MRLLSKPALLESGRPGAAAAVVWCIPKGNMVAAVAADGLGRWLPLPPLVPLGAGGVEEAGGLASGLDWGS